jgi:peroxiredoxin
VGPNALQGAGHGEGQEDRDLRPARGAFTPTCSAKHVPSYLTNLDKLKAKGVDEVWCLAVNDAFVMHAWALDQKAQGKIRFLGRRQRRIREEARPRARPQSRGMGTRMQRFSMLGGRWVVKQLNIEGAGQVRVSDAETMLKDA